MVPHRRPARVFGNTVGARLRAVRRTEGIHDEDVAKRCHLASQRLVAGFFALEKSHVLTEDDLAWIDVDAVDPVPRQRYVTSQQSRAMVGKMPIVLVIS